MWLLWMWRHLRWIKDCFDPQNSVFKRINWWFLLINSIIISILCQPKHKMQKQAQNAEAVRFIFFFLQSGLRRATGQAF